MKKRKQPNLTERLSSALLALGEIPFEDAQKMSDKQVISLYQFDHYPIRHADGGPTVGWNLTPRLIVPHRVKTATIDIPAMAKDRRVSAKWDEFTARMAAKTMGTEALDKAQFGNVLHKRPKRSKQKMPSRPFPKRRKKT